MKKSLIALAMGTFSLGMTEYVMMGILPYIADDFHISIPEAGHFISAYAIGVCVGAPAIAMIARRWKLNTILHLLISLIILGSIAMTFCPTPQAGTEGSHSWQYLLMMGFRFIAGLPHGAYFGVSSIIVDRLTQGQKSSFGVAIVNSGMTIANLIGIPLGTLLTDFFSWRMVFGFSALWTILTLIAVVRNIPHMEALPDHGARGAFRFLKSAAPWLIIFATVFGNGGVFCWYSYVSPMATQLAGIPVNGVTLLMVLAGAGMVVGNLLGGRLSDKIGPGPTGRLLATITCISLVLIALTGQYQWCLIPLIFVTCGCLFSVSPPQQLLLLRFSKGGELMGGAMVQIAFNLGNAIGAWLGGLPIIETEPSSYQYTAVVGAIMSFGAILCYIAFCRRYRS